MDMAEEVDHIFDQFTSGEFEEELSHDTFIMSLLNDANLSLGDNHFV